MISDYQFQWVNDHDDWTTRKLRLPVGTRVEMEKECNSFVMACQRIWCWNAPKIKGIRFLPASGSRHRIINCIHLKRWHVILRICPKFNCSLVKPPLKLGHRWVISSDRKECAWLFNHSGVVTFLRYRRKWSIGYVMCVKYAYNTSPLAYSYGT